VLFEAFGLDPPKGGEEGEKKRRIFKNLRKS